MGRMRDGAVRPAVEDASMDSIETLIVGGGQAGLALSYELTRAGREHVVLERARLVERWRSERWDSLTLLSPNWMTRLPGWHYAGSDPDGFMHRDEVVGFYEAYAAAFAAPVQTEVNVTSVDVDTSRGDYLVATDRGTWRARNVVVATGMFQQPRLPGWSSQLPPAIVQVHSSHYRNPYQLPPGAVLVAGSGASGFQIAEELNRQGRRVYFSLGRHERLPRRYRGHDVMWWLDQMGIFDQLAATPTDHWQHASAARSASPPSPALTGVGGGHDLDPHRLAADGVALLGRTAGMNDGVLSIAPDLTESLRAGDAGFLAWRQRIDGYIRANAIDVHAAPDPDLWPISSAEREPLNHVDIRAAAVSAIVWATGFRADFSWVHAPVLEDGRPVHYRGVTEAPGLFFLRIAPFYKRRATLIDGLDEDAGFLADQIVRDRPQALADLVRSASGSH
jgi:putative flavoprotein involved in K+ transport